MASYSKITVIGHVVRDPEQRYLPTGELVAEFTVPYTDRKRQGDTWVDGTTAWYRVSAFGRTAEVAVASLHKGTPVFIEGVLLPRTYVDRAGETRVSLDVRCRELRVLEKRAEGSPEPGGVSVNGGSRSEERSTGSDENTVTLDQAAAESDDWLF